MMSLPILTHPEQEFDKLKTRGVSVVAFLDTVRPRKDGSFTIRLRLTYRRFPKYYSTKISMSTEGWKRLNGERPKSEIQNTRSIIYKQLKKAIDIIYQMESFSFEKFERDFYLRPKEHGDVFTMYNKYIEELKNDDRVGSENVYKYSLKSLKDFTGTKTLSFAQVTIRFLKNYVKKMKEKGASNTTIGMYLKCLRFLYNNAVKEGIISNADYPFSKDKFQIPSSQNIKKAISLKEIGQIYYYKPINQAEKYYRDIWIFSYLCNGINMKDICLLRYKDIQGNHIHFRRAKTISTNQGGKPIDALITEDIQNIITEWGVTPIISDNYIFPVVVKGLTAHQIQSRIKQFTQQTNKYIKRIAKKLEIEKNISTYTARHSFATVLKNSGTNMSFIMESLGHSSLKTTESYLGSFEDDQKKEIVKKLTEFKNEE